MGSPASARRYAGICSRLGDSPARLAGGNCSRLGSPRLAETAGARGKPPRPLSAASTCSSSSSSGEAGVPSAAAYLASTESLEACSSEDEDEVSVIKSTVVFLHNLINALMSHYII